MNIEFMGFYASVPLFLSLLGQNLKLEVLDLMISDYLLKTGVLKVCSPCLIC